MFEFIHILQGLTIKQDGLALLTRYKCLHHLGLRGVNVHTDCGGMVDNCFNQGISEVRHVDVVAELHHQPFNISVKA